MDSTPIDDRELERDRELFLLFNEHIRELISTHQLIVETNATALRYANSLFLRVFPSSRAQGYGIHRPSRNNSYTIRRTRQRHNSDDEPRIEIPLPAPQNTDNRQTDIRQTDIRQTEEPTTPPITQRQTREPPPAPRATRTIRMSQRTTIPAIVNTRNQHINTRIEELMFPEVTNVQNFLPGFMENMERLAEGGLNIADNSQANQQDRENRLRQFFINASMPFLEGTTAGEENNNGLTPDEIRLATTCGPYCELRQQTATESSLNPRLDSENNVVPTEHDRCPITWTQFNDNTEVTRINRCGHMFTPIAINQWLSRHSTCPTCRAELPRNNPPAPPLTEPQPAGDPDLPVAPPVGIDIRESSASTNIFTNVLRGAPINNQQAFLDGIREATEALTSNVVNNNM